MRILGISAFYHDSAAAIVEDGHIIAAAQEERFSRTKFDSCFPHASIRYCLEAAGTHLEAIDHVVFYEKPFLKFERLVESYLSYAPSGFASFRQSMPLWLKEKLFQKSLLVRELKKIGNKFDAEKLLFAEHHQSHAASAFYPSPFEEAVVLTLDGVGEWATASVGVGKGNSLRIDKEIHYPHSLGLLYSAFTYYLGFKVNSGEYKLMGLAPYGAPRYLNVILEKLVDVKPDGSFRLAMEYFNYCTGLTMTNKRFEKLFGLPVRKPEEKLTQQHMDIAASMQAALDEILLKMTRALHAHYGIDQLCLAGGVALNCVTNGQILRDGQFKKIWIQPAAGDAGGALGAALAAYYDFLKQPRKINAGDSMQGAFLGPHYSQSEVEKRLTACGAVFETVEGNALTERMAEYLAKGEAIVWSQGRMEYGPRSLGNRSILADPRDPSMQKRLNLSIKYRESFRPFAPAVLSEDAAEWFDLAESSPYMLLVAGVAESRRGSIPAVTHVDNSARVQTVHKETNTRFHALLAAFKQKTGCPVLVNTSFNVRGEPIVCTPEDAFRCFMGMQLEVLVIENCLLLKSRQTVSFRRADFAPD